MTDQAIEAPVRMDWEHGTPMMVGPWMVGLADPSPETLEYWRAVADDRLVLKQCGACGKHHHPRRMFCYVCGSDDMRWIDAAGTGEIYTYSVVHRAPTEAFQRETPYTVGILKLAEGVFFFSRLYARNGGEVKIGAPAEVEFEEVSTFGKMPVFTWADAAPSAQVNESCVVLCRRRTGERRYTKPILMLHGFARTATSGPIEYRPVRGPPRGPPGSARLRLQREDPGADYEFAVPDLVSDYSGCSTRSTSSESTTSASPPAASSGRPPRQCTPTGSPASPWSRSGSDHPHVGSQGQGPRRVEPREFLVTLGLEQWWLQSRALTNDLFGDERDGVIARDFARTPLHVALGMWRGMHKPEVSLAPHLPKLRTRTLILTPTGSSTMSVEQQQELVAGIPGARQRIYDGAPHGMYYLRGAELARDVLEFIDAE